MLCPALGCLLVEGRADIDAKCSWSRTAEKILKEGLILAFLYQMVGKESPLTVLVDLAG